MRLDTEYYITKNLIPPLERIFNLVGANVRSWYEDMPKVHTRNEKDLYNEPDISRRATLHSFMKSRFCAVCKAEDTDDSMMFLGYIIVNL